MALPRRTWHAARTNGSMRRCRLAEGSPVSPCAPRTPSIWQSWSHRYRGSQRRGPCAGQAVPWCRPEMCPLLHRRQRHGRAWARTAREPAALQSQSAKVATCNQAACRRHAPEGQLGLPVGEGGVDVLEEAGRVAVPPVRGADAASHAGTQCVHLHAGKQCVGRRLAQCLCMAVQGSSCTEKEGRECARGRRHAGAANGRASLLRTLASKRRVAALPVLRLASAAGTQNRAAGGSFTFPRTSP